MAADFWKQAFELQPGDKVATHYSTPSATVTHRITTDEDTIVILMIPNGEKVRVDEESSKRK